MKTIKQNRARNIGRAALITTALSLAMANNAFAAGTASGTVIGNTATIGYSVDGTEQVSIDASATFKVGTKVNLTLVESGNGATSVAPDSDLQATTFTLTNIGNAAQGYNLEAANLTGDNFDVTTFAYYLDDGNGSFDSNDTAISFVDSLAAEASIVIHVTASIGTQIDGDQSNISLTAVTTADNTGGSAIVALVETAGGYVSGDIQIVFADDLGATTGARDASSVAFDAYLVVTATLTVSKTTAVYSDPANGTTDAKAIPGAILTYTITIVNTGSATATAVNIQDSLNAEIVAGTVVFNTQYNDGTTGCANNEGIAVKDGGGTVLCITSNNTGGGADFGITTANTVTATGLTLDATETATMSFQVIIL